jgi:hypothetical protein
MRKESRRATIITAINQIVRALQSFALTRMAGNAETKPLGCFKYGISTN